MRLAGMLPVQGRFHEPYRQPCPGFAPSAFSDFPQTVCPFLHESLLPQPARMPIYPELCRRRQIVQPLCRQQRDLAAFYDLLERPMRSHPLLQQLALMRLQSQSDVLVTDLRFLIHALTHTALSQEAFEELTVCRVFATFLRPCDSQTCRYFR
jgi:hypothetical protein